MRDAPDSLGSQGSLTRKLHAKSRQRREAQTRPPSVPDSRRFRNSLLPELKLEQIALDRLQAPPKAIRIANELHVHDVARGVQSLGFCVPALVDDDNTVIDGWIRVEAARLVGLDNIPCIRIAHLTPGERRVLRLAVNRLGEKGEWDFDELKLEFEELILADAPIEISGFDPVEIDQILLEDDHGAVEAGPLAPEEGAATVARPGDIFALGRHLVICADATDPEMLRRLVPDDAAPIRLLLTDEPYNVPIAGHVTGGNHREFAMASGEMSDEEFLKFNLRWMEVALNYVCDGGLVATFIDWRGYPTVHAAAKTLGLEPTNLVVWGKTNAGMGSLYRSQHELMPLFKKGKAPHVNNVSLGKKGRWRSNLWTYAGASSLGSDARRGLREHPTVKPTAMLEDALLDLTRRGDVVLDPFLGSGSTLIAAERTQRMCLGVEIDPAYVDIIIRRYQSVTGSRATLTLTGQTFNEMAALRGNQADR